MVAVVWTSGSRDRVAFALTKLVKILQKEAKKGGKTPKSAPSAHGKRKKLEEEIDEELSDNDFEVCSHFFHPAFLRFLGNSESFVITSSTSAVS